MAGDDDRDTQWPTRPGAGAAPPPIQPQGARAVPAAAAQGKPVDGLAVTGLVLGAVAVLLCWLPFLGSILSILAIIFGAIGIGRKISVGMGVTGLVLGIVTFLVNIGVSVWALTTGSKGIL